MLSKLRNRSSELVNISENWSKLSILLKERFASLTENDLKFVRGKENELLSKLSFRLNKRRQEVIEIIKNIQT